MVSRHVWKTITWNTPKPQTLQCPAHGVHYMVKDGCVLCRVNVKPDPER